MLWLNLGFCPQNLSPWQKRMRGKLQTSQTKKSGNICSVLFGLKMTGSLNDAWYWLHHYCLALRSFSSDIYHIKILYQEYNKNNVVMLSFLCYCSDFKKITWCYTFHQYTCTFNINFCGFYCWNCNLKINVHWSAIFYNILYQLDHRPQIYYIAITLTFS